MTDEKKAELLADGYWLNDCRPPYAACSECASMNTILRCYDEGDGLGVKHIYCLDCGYDFWD